MNPDNVIIEEHWGQNCVKRYVDGELVSTESYERSPFVVVPTMIWEWDELTEVRVK